MRILATKTGLGRNRQLSPERLINLFPEQAPSESKTPVSVLGVPGKTEFCKFNGPGIRAMIEFNSKLYVVSGNSLYRISNTGSEALLGNIGSSTGYVSMSHNGSQIVISDGSNEYFDGYFLFVGSTWGYTYDTTNGLVEITDADFPPSAANSVFWISSLFDGTAYDASDYASEDSYPDSLMKVFRDHDEVFLCGPDSIVPWQNAGNADFPFAPIKGAVIDYGLGAFDSVQRVDNSFIWLDSYGIVRRAGQGWAPIRVSTHAVEHDLNKARIAGTMGDCSSWAYSEEGHEFYVLNIQNIATWCYDAATQQWHNRQSYGLPRDRADKHAKCYGKQLVGDYATATIWELSLDVYAEGDNPQIADMIFPEVYAEGRRMIVDRVELVGEMGVGLATGQGSSPQYMFQYSEDGGRTWSAEMWKSMGVMGDYVNKPEWRRLGVHRSFTPRVKISDPVKRAFYMAHVDARVCSS